jgi:hypothetical protein
MALSPQLGFPDVPKSVTNPKVFKRDALDVGSPIPLLTFIKIINVTFEPDSLQKYYNFYVKAWNSISKSKKGGEHDQIIDRYREFLKDISLNYTTLEEKEFLSNIDFNDPYDLDISIGFYGKKLREIVSFYNNKRNDVKFNITRNKLRGSNFGLEKSITELTLSYLTSLDDNKILYDYDDIKLKLEVEIDELYDNHQYYFNQASDTSVYDYKDLDYGLNIFLKEDPTLISELFSGLSEDLKNIKEVDELFENKRKLTSKYIATDFYYMATGETTTDFISGKLLDSISPASNFFNRDYPTTASTAADQLITKRDQGFFTPHNVSILLVDGERSSFSFNLSNLAPNSLYFFPDPNIVGANGDILTFMVDDTSLKRNGSSDSARNQPYTDGNDSKYYGYVSRIEPIRSKYLDSIFDSGYIKDQKRDIYGNLFGLFINDGKFYKNIEFVPETNKTSLILNGHKFYDDVYNEGFSFNYLTEDSSTFNETIRSGLSTNTGNLSGGDVDYTIFLGTFNNYQIPTPPTDENLITSYNIVEGGYILNDDIPYDDAVSSNLSSFETSTGSFYYTTLREFALHTAAPLQRALLDPSYPSLTGDLTEFIRSSAVVDGGFLGNPLKFELPFTFTNYMYDESFTNITEFEPENVPDFTNNLYIRNTSSRNVATILNTLPYLTSKYTSDIVSEMDGSINNYDLVNDNLFLETTNYLTINKLIMEDGEFIDPRTPAIYRDHSLGDFDKISNRYKVGNFVYYCKMQALSTSDNNFTLYPEIYKFDLVYFENTPIFTLSDIDVDLFKVHGNNIRNTFCDAPKITYSSRNNIFNISVLLKDQNNQPTLHSYDYHLAPNVTMLDHKITYFGNDGYSNIFDATELTTFNIFLSSAPITTLDEELIL